MSKTIQIGIDLGTTNSAVVAHIDDKYEVIKNSDQLEYTPSVFGYNKGKNIQVGKKAYEQLFHFPDDENINNYKAEVKRLMGTHDTIHFSRVGTTMSPEEISSEILKYLKESVLRKYPELNTDGVVITVPAYFDTIQKEATSKAGKLAGFNHVVLIQEPIAAAIAYGFDNKYNENWLVYDLGGGTFDVAIVSSKDGVLTVKGHAGDNYLGGKDIDNLIVDNIIVPKLIEAFDIDLDRNNDKNIYNVFKYIAEAAKKDLTDSETTTMVIDNPIVVDNNGAAIYLDIVFSRSEFEGLIDNLVDKTIKLCHNALTETGFSKENINKIILVGGPTQIPYIKKKLSESFGITVDSSVDPLTVVAKGACVFGGSQIIPKEKGVESVKKKIDTVSIDLHYDSMVSDTDTMVTGAVQGLPSDKEYYIQIQSSDGKYSSSKIKLKNGKFFDTVLVEESKANIYHIYLSDSLGTIISTDPESFVITHGLSIAGTPISHSVSVVLNKKEFMSDENEEYCNIIFERGSILPLKSTQTYRTSRELKKGDKVNILPIKIYEGESKKPDRNKQICGVKLTGSDIPYSLPEGTEVQLTVEIDISGILNVSAYFPSIDVLKTGKSLRTEGEQDAMTTNEIYMDLAKEKERLTEMTDHLSAEDKASIENDIEAIEKHVHVEDRDSKNRTHSHLRQLKHKMDKYELQTQSSKLTQDFYAKIKGVEELLQSDTSSSDYKQLEILKEEGATAIESKDWEKLDVINDKIGSLSNSLVFNSPEGLKMLLSILYERRNEATDPVKVNEIFTRVVPAINSNDVNGMRMAIQELFLLMPADAAASISGISGITL